MKRRMSPRHPPGMLSPFRPSAASSSRDFEVSEEDLMMYLAGLLISLVQGASDGSPAVEWLDDLDTACERARVENKLVLYRQALCNCRETACPYADLLRRPAFLDEAGARETIRRECVAVSVRKAPERDMEGLQDAGYGALLTRGAPLRTYILTPSRHILHRLDLCPYASDLSGEIDYAYMVRLTCFISEGVPDPEAATKIKRLHDQHVTRPRSYHKAQGGAPASECRCPSPRQGGSGSWNPWPGYTRGLSWHTDPDEAKALARHSKRRLLFFQVVGDLNKEGC